MKVPSRMIFKIIGLTILFICMVLGQQISAEDKNAEPEEEEHGGKIMYEKPVKAVFDHELHIEQGLDCDSCHDEIFEMETGAAEASGEFTMAIFSQGKYCGACHDGDTAFDAYSQCDSCHFAPKGPVIFTEPVKAVIFEHSIHSEENGISCEECHRKLFRMVKGSNQKKPDFSMENMYCNRTHVKYCGICHDGDTAFADTTQCTRCHIGVKGYNRIMGKQPEKGGH